MQNSSVHKAAQILMQANVIDKNEKNEWWVQKDWEHWLKTDPRQGLLFTAPEGVGRPPKCPLKWTKMSTKVDTLSIIRRKENKEILHSVGVHYSGHPADPPLTQIIKTYYTARALPIPKKNLRVAFGAHWKYAQGILAAADEDVKLAIQAVKDIVPWCEKQNWTDDWGIRAVLARYPEWSKERTEDEKEKIRAGC